MVLTHIWRALIEGRNECSIFASRMKQRNELLHFSHLSVLLAETFIVVSFLDNEKGKKFHFEYCVNKKHSSRLAIRYTFNAY